VQPGEDVTLALAAQVEHLAVGQLLGDDRERRPLGLEHRDLPAVAVDGNVDAGERADLPGPRPGRVHDRAAAEPALARRHAHDTSGGDRERGHLRALPHLDVLCEGGAEQRPVRVAVALAPERRPVGADLGRDGGHLVGREHGAVGRSELPAQGERRPERGPVGTEQELAAAEERHALLVRELLDDPE
jgi:hypothetical protein